MDNEFSGEGRPKKKRKIRIIIHKDKKGRYVIIKGKKTYIKSSETKLSTKSKKKLAKAVYKKIRPSIVEEEKKYVKPYTQHNLGTKDAQKLGLIADITNSYKHSIANEQAQRERDRKEYDERERNTIRESFEKAKTELKKDIIDNIKEKYDNGEQLNSIEQKLLDKRFEYIDQLNKNEAILEIKDYYDDYLNLLKNPQLSSLSLSKEPLEDLDKEELDKLLKVRFLQYGHGNNDDKGLSNFQIDKIMSKYPEFLGTISHDEIKSKILPLIKPKSRGGFVINTDPHNKPGEHWLAVYFDGRPGGDATIEFFDSFAEDIDPKLQKDLLLIANKLNAGTYLKYKYNRIRYQNDKSSNCGYFAMKFLIDRFRGKPFIDASGFNDIKYGESNIEKFKKQVGGKYIKFPYVASFGGALVDFRENYPPQVRKYLENNEPITSLVVCREPISGALDTAINILSLGKWNQAKKELGYDKLFHLYFIINNKYRLERNHVITMYPQQIREKTEKSYVPINKQITIKELLENTAKLVGPDLQRYDPGERNCQVFCVQVLKANGLLNNTLQTFIMQDAKSVIEKLPRYAQFLAQLTTDTAHVADKIVHGNSRI